MAQDGQFPKLKVDVDAVHRHTSSPLSEQIEEARTYDEEAVATTPDAGDGDTSRPSRKTQVSPLATSRISTEPTIPEESPDSSDHGIHLIRTRGSSIAFHPKVLTESGHTTPLHGAESAGSTPPVRDGSVLTRAAYAGANDSNPSAWGDQELNDGTEEVKPVQDRPRPPRSREVRKILLQSDTGFSDHSDYFDQDKVASLTSATTSPSLDEARTPLEGAGGGDYVLSPVAAISPLEFPPFQNNNTTAGSWPWRSPSQRTLSRSDRMSRKDSRRASSKAASSPASAFLAQWGRAASYDNTEADNTPAAPDSEGQEIADSGYIIGKRVGRGAFSVVKEALTMENGVKVTRAVKIVRKTIEGKDETENEKVQAEFDREVSIWRYLKHPYVLPLLVVFETPSATFCITHLNHGGTLLSCLAENSKRNRQNTRSSSASVSSNWGTSSWTSAWGSSSQTLPPKPEPEEDTPVPPPGLPVHLARRYLFQLASALRYLHEDVRVVHRDIKPDNCLIDMTGPNAANEGGNLLLCDFGLAEFISNDGRASPTHYDSDVNTKSAGDEGKPNKVQITGSANYIAPESIDSLRAVGQPIFSPSVDMWAFGIVAYSVFAGALPFANELQALLLTQISRAEYNKEKLSASLKAYGFDPELGVEEMVTGCLERDTNRRWLVSDVLQMKWFEGAEKEYGVDRDWMVDS